MASFEIWLWQKNGKSKAVANLKFASKGASYKWLEPEMYACNGQRLKYKKIALRAFKML